MFWSENQIKTNGQASERWTALAEAANQTAFRRDARR